MSGCPRCSWRITRCRWCSPFPGGFGSLFSLKMPRLGWFSSSDRDPPPALSHSQPFSITSRGALNPSAPTFPRILVGQPRGSWRDGCLCSRGCSRGQRTVPEPHSLFSGGFVWPHCLCRQLWFEGTPTSHQQHTSGSNTREKVPGRENWELVYPNAVAVNWLQLFTKIFCGSDHSSRRQQEKQ